MRINNKRVNVWVASAYSLFLMALAFSILLLIVPISPIVNKVSPYLLIGLSLFLIFIFYKLGHQNFEYNSDGEVLNIKTHDPFWIQYFPNSKVFVDFPKKKLTGYQIRNKILTRKLDLFLKSKRTKKGYIRLTFTITYLNHSEITDLKKSLNRILANNKLAIQNETNQR